MCSLPTASHCSTMMMSLIVILIFFGDDFDADDDKDDFLRMIFRVHFNPLENASMTSNVRTTVGH